MKYYADFSDEFFPQVRVWIDDTYPAPPEGTTFTKAKAEIRERVQHKLSHWRAIREDLAKLKAKDVWR